MYINKMWYKILHIPSVKFYVRFFQKRLLLNEKFENLSLSSFGQWGGEGEVPCIRPSGFCSTPFLCPCPDPCSSEALSAGRGGDEIRRANTEFAALSCFEGPPHTMVALLQCRDDLRQSLLPYSSSYLLGKQNKQVLLRSQGFRFLVSALENLHC